jgi:hypothetical protein
MPFFWSGYNQRYWFTQTVVFFILIALSTKSLDLLKSKRINLIISITIVLLLIVNLFGVFIPSTNRENDQIYKKIETIAKTAKKGDVVIYKNIWTFGFYISTYIPGATELNFGFLTDKNTLLKSEKELDNIDKTLQKNDIYILEDVFNETRNYPKEIYSRLDLIQVKYGKYTKRYHNNFLNYYKISKSIEN